jgi:sugar lactone lactonase YvrE
MAGLLGILVTLTATEAWGADRYRYQRLWPTLQQPWYFSLPNDVATDADGYVYIADTFSYRIQKFTADGGFVTAWATGILPPRAVSTGPRGDIYVAGDGGWVLRFSPDGEFPSSWLLGDDLAATGMAIDHRGVVYIADGFDHAIALFTTEGTRIGRWDTPIGDEPGQVNGPWDLAVDDKGFVYIADTFNHRVQKFSTHGTWVDEWGEKGKAEGQFNEPIGIAVAGDRVYVVDSLNDRVQVFNLDGGFQLQFGSEGSGDGEFYAPTGLTVDGDGFIYVADSNRRRIQKFAPDGTFVANWQSRGGGPGWFEQPHGIAVAPDGTVYVADSNNHRIQRFDNRGRFLAEWGSEGTGDRQFDAPYGVAVAPDGTVYVADTLNDRIQRFEADGTHLATWNGADAGGDPLDSPADLAVDDDGSVYVADWENSRISKYTAAGDFLAQWTGADGNAGPLDRPLGIAVSGNTVYVADTDNDQIQIFDRSGTPIGALGASGHGEGQLYGPTGIAVDPDGRVLVCDRYNHRVQAFLPDGTFESGFGGFGSAPGQMKEPAGIAVGADGTVYLADTENNRVQVFQRVGDEDRLIKAVIVAGGGDYRGNNLWPATAAAANFAYRALTHQGFSRERIRYLTSDLELDLDDNADTVDVHGAPGGSALAGSITDWAADADGLIVYLVDHGKPGLFRLSESEVLTAGDLDGWLDALQSDTGSDVVVIYDACNAGSFLPELTPPAGSNRAVMAGTDADEDAFFVSQGALSFSGIFWNRIFNGDTLAEAFDGAAETMGGAAGLQHPVVDANGDGVGNEADDYGRLADFSLVNAGEVPGTAPTIGGVTVTPASDDLDLAIIRATEVSDGVARVWAEVRPPSAGSRPDGTDSVLNLPSVTLAPDGARSWSGRLEGLSGGEEYLIAVYARDRAGNLSLPEIRMFTPGSTLRRRAILVGGGSGADDRWTVTRNAITLAGEALTVQGYAPDDIRVLSPVPFSPDVDAAATALALRTAITDWAAANTRDLVLYIVGPGADGAVFLNEPVSATDIDTWLDSLQSSLTGTLTVVLDVDDAGRFLPRLTPPAGRDRILIAGGPADSPAFIAGGESLFSGFFWRNIGDGKPVGSAFFDAADALSVLTGADRGPLLDDTGNGIGNERADGRRAGSVRIGAGVGLASDPPVVAAVTADETVPPSGEVEITASGVTAVNGDVATVWATIALPADPALAEPPEPVTLNLEKRADATYGATFDETEVFGTYTISVYARDEAGNVSLDSRTAAFQPRGPDVFEPDDAVENAGGIILNAPEPQTRSFHQPGDVDWVRFYAVEGTVYTLSARTMAPGSEPVLSLIDHSGDLVTRWDGPLSADGTREVSWRCDLDGIYQLKIENADPEIGGVGVGYELRIYPPVGPFAGFVNGSVIDAVTGLPVSGATIQTDAGASDISRPNGRFLLIQAPGVSTLSAEAPGYEMVGVSSVTVGEAGTTIENILLRPIDRDGDGIPDAEDAFPDDPSETADSDGDGVGDNADGCPDDPAKREPGQCGCGIPETDTDGDGTPDCADGCPGDPDKIAPGPCGCGVSDADSDGDGTPDCMDDCPDDPQKTEPGVCGCGIPDIDADGNGIIDCLESPQIDSDGDGTPDAADGCPTDPEKIEPGVCGCGLPDTDTDGDGRADCLDGCPDDPDKIEPGACGCGVPDTDADGDGIPDCADDNRAPAVPVPLGPADAEVDLSTTLTLRIGPFDDPDPQDTHAETRWRIAQSEDSAPVLLDLTTTRHLTALPVPAGLLEGGRTYFYRASVVDSRGEASPFSPPAEFSTTRADGDEDDDGIPDAAQPDGPTDIDGDGEADAETGIRVVATANGDSIMGVSADGPAAWVMAVVPCRVADVAEDPPPAGDLPLGVVSVRLGADAVGGTAVITFHLAEPAPFGTVWVGLDLTAGWYLADRAQWSEDRRSVRLEVTDGGPYDMDGAANGAMLVTGGPAIGEFEPLTLDFAPPPGDVGGGCYIRTLTP